ncbi:RsmB/NOP family class I SAM-dependent RNA methyltransferase [Paenibacillus sp. JX-17]|uniref:RsmB/NOP family class I SAM-dependent RNA methyltransferase n=1 Tax=Paenibacillus lacisoli TaxID=3064525 RepID=A0ABT9C9R0_9BACL|nr:RsmB/NOP family class I SAM-dependent RNA methyltransferase [Paenibacillus sp. JX-17]MDO7905990.1 RsmB/NOP family class I SAM-dependent RNA methyltransferase [Paenibacillus sp. JX-17]
MAVRLPAAFVERMQHLLGDEFDSFMKSYDSAPHAGIRVNTLKASVKEFQRLTPFELTAIPWCPSGFYVPYGTKPGLHPYYHAGIYYIQEPSAMAPAELLGVKPGDRVLDLCAAPGGKSTQIAAKLEGQGVLVTNDISADRTKALAKNIELYGVRNAVVLNETPQKIADAFPNYFDKILIDAPCSGEGMFRKDEDMIKQWETHSVERCVLMQRDILQTAASLLAPGGTIVYSTCTFAPEENESMIGEFLQAHPDFRVIPVGPELGFRPGRPDWLQGMAGTDDLSDQVKEQLTGTGRLWPHVIEGEGHYAAVLQQVIDPDTAADVNASLLTSESAFEESVSIMDSSLAVQTEPGNRERKSSRRSERLKREPGGRTADHGHRHKSKEGGRRGQPPAADPLEVYRQFVSVELRLTLPGETVMYGDRIYQCPVDPRRLDGLKVVRPGWFTGNIKNGRFVPSHPLAAALHPEEAVRTVNLLSGNGEAVRYLKGETLAVTADSVQCKGNVSPKGYVLVCIDGYAAGWGKWLDGMLRNEYPAGWRWTSV